MTGSPEPRLIGAEQEPISRLSREIRMGPVNKIKNARVAASLAGAILAMAGLTVPAAAQQMQAAK